MRRLALVVLSAVLLPLAVPNDIFKYGNPLLGLVCMVPFYLAARERDTYGFSVLLGMLFGMLSTLIMYYWLQFFGEYSVWTLGGVDFAYIIYGVILYPAISYLLAVFPRHKPFVFACAWLVYEFLKSIGFLAFPWGLLAHPFHGILPFIQFADITGVWGVSFLAALLNACIAEWIAYPFGSVSPYWPGSNRSDILLTSAEKKYMPARFLHLVRQTAFVLTLVCAAFAYGGYRMLAGVPVESTFKAVLVQPNVDPWARNVYEKSTMNAILLSEQGIAKLGGKPDLVIWNETSFQHPFPDAEITLMSFPRQRPFIDFVKSTGAYFLVGAPYLVNREDYSMMNATVLVSPDGKTAGYYGKMQPVPFAESNPFFGIKALQPLFKAIGISWSGWTMGNTYTVLTVPLQGRPQLAFSTPICFEDAFPDLCRRFFLNGASLLVNLTNVSWSKTESAEIQMFVASKFRSVETKRTLVRSTNSGVTSVIGPFGDTLAAIPLFTESYIAMDIPVYKEKSFTVYTVCGDWLPWLAGFVIFFVLVYNLLAIRGLIVRRFPE